MRRREENDKTSFAGQLFSTNIPVRRRSSDKNRSSGKFWDHRDWKTESKCSEEKRKTELFSTQNKFKTHMIEILDIALIKYPRESEKIRWPMRLV